MREVRYTPTEFELRGGKGEGATLAGYAAVFNSPTVIADLFREQVAPRAFRKTIKESDIRALFNHDPNIVLGRNRAKTLRLSEDDAGLRYEIDLPETQLARDLWTSIERGDVSQSSFAFETVTQTRESGQDGEMPLRTLKEVRLYDVSPVTYPAYEDTEVQARAAELFATWTALPDEARDEEQATTTQPDAQPPEQHSAPTTQPEPQGLPIYVARLGILERQ